MATLGGHTNWSHASSVGMHTAMSSRKVIAHETAPLSLLLNTALGGSSQQSLVQEVAGSMLVSSQNALTMGETATSHAFPFSHCHHRPHTASPTLCKAREYTSNHSELSTSPCTSSHIMNCPMFRMVGVGGQMSHPCTLRLHRQTARRHLASERAMPLAPDINGMTHSYQGTSSSEMPWTANCTSVLFAKWGQLFPGSPPLHRCLGGMWPTALGILQSIQALPQLRICCHCPLATSHGRPAYAEFGNRLSMPHLDRARPGPSPCRSGWTGHGGNIDH